MLPDDVAGNGQPEARAAAAHPNPIDLVEAFEDPRPVGGRDADPVILDRQQHGVANGPDGDPDLGDDGLGRDAIPVRNAVRNAVRDPVQFVGCAVRSILGPPELQRVVDEVDHDLAEPGLVAANHWRASRNVDDEAQTLALGEETEPLRGL